VKYKVGCGSTSLGEYKQLRRTTHVGQVGHLPGKKVPNRSQAGSAYSSVASVASSAYSSLKSEASSGICPCFEGERLIVVIASATNTATAHSAGNSLQLSSMNWVSVMASFGVGVLGGVWLIMTS
jgi:hypothetical protein